MAPRAEEKSSQYQLDFSHFLNFPEQIAVRLQTHSSLGNFLCHLAGAPMLGVAIFGLLQSGGSTTLALTELAMAVVFALSNDLLFGMTYMTLCAMMTYVQLAYFPPLSLLTCLALLGSAVFVLVRIGHGVFEASSTEPSVPYGGNGALFSTTLRLMHVISASFHFYSMLALKLGLRPKLKADIDAVMDRMRETTDNRKTD